MSYARAFITRRGLAAAALTFLISACAERGASPAGPAASIDSPDAGVVQRTAAAAGKFDGEWSGLLVPRGDQDKKYPAYP